jgi:vacuole morphology and inheritance protein 14
MAQTLNLILITAPETIEMRRRLKNIETRDGFSLFSCLYRSWCHNPIACFSLCLLAQAYEHASLLMTVIGELEITVSMLVQTDKLVQLLESPVFTSLRLQLLEPDKYPHLYKCLYGILMVLPQSSAFATLRNRLACLGNVAALPSWSQPSSLSAAASASSPTGNKQRKSLDVMAIPPSKWSEFLVHFKGIQGRHERARRACKSMVH